MSDLSNKIIADLKVELAESKAAANRVTESMGSEIMRLQGELEQQRTRAEAAEQELREANRQREIEKRVLWSCWEWFDDHDDRKTSAEIHHELQQVVGEWHGCVVDDSGIAHYGAAGLAAKLAAIRAHLAGVDWGEIQALEVDLRRMEDSADSDLASLIAAAREALEP